MKKFYFRLALGIFAVVMVSVVVLFLPTVMQSSAEKGVDPSVTLFYVPVTTSQPAPLTTDSQFVWTPLSSDEIGYEQTPVESDSDALWKPDGNGIYNYKVITGYGEYGVKSEGLIHNGVYALFNIGTYHGHLGYENGVMHMVEYTVSPAADFNTNGLFRITRVPDTNRYIIRNLENPTLTFGFYDGEFEFKKIPANDADVKPEDTFVFSCDGNGFTITPYGAEASICCDFENKLVWGTAESCDRYARWYFERFMGEIPEKYMR